MSEPATQPSQQQIAAVLESCLVTLSKNGLTYGEAADVETRLRWVLTRDERNYQALQLLGLVAKFTDRPAESRQYFERSLAIEPNQPHVHFNLANLLYQDRRVDEAIAAYRAAIGLKPNYFDAFINLALAQKWKKDFRGAEQTYRRALHLQPSSLLAKQGLAAVLIDLERGVEAENICRQALASDIADKMQAAVFHYNLGVALKIQGKHEAAIAAFDEAMTLHPDLPRLNYLRGGTFLAANRLDEALREYRAALAKDPRDLGAHWELNRLLYRRGDSEEFLASYDRAIAQSPDVGELYLGKATFLFQKEEFEEARKHYEIAAELLPDNVTPLDGLGMIAARAQDHARARKEHERAVALEPANADLWRNYAESLVRAGDPEAALSAIGKALSIDPDHQGSLAMWATILDLLEDPLGQMVNDFGSLVQEFEITPPFGWNSTSDFNAELLSHLDKLHVDRRESVDQSLRFGTQTFENLFGKGRGIVENLRLQIDRAVETYISRMPDRPDHPLFRRKSGRFRYSASWSCQLHDNGYHINHYHPKGWISSAYYVSVPEVSKDERARQGWIKFGEPYFDAGLKDPIRRVIEPVNGKLVLFPSYMWHGTIPFRSGQKRTTVAFDVVPADPAA